MFGGRCRLIGVLDGGMERSVKGEILAAKGPVDGIVTSMNFPLNLGTVTPGTKLLEFHEVIHAEMVRRGIPTE